MNDIPDPSHLTAHLGYWLRYVSNHVSYGFARKLQGRDVTVAEWVLMRELYGEAAAPSRLADKLGMTRGAITKLADRLIAKALIERVANTDDLRGQTLALTETGRALVPDLASLADANDAAFFGHIEAAEREALIRLLQDIVKRHGLNAVPIV